MPHVGSVLPSQPAIQLLLTIRGNLQTLDRPLIMQDKRQNQELQGRKRLNMLWTLFVILLLFWAVGVISSHTMGGFLHVLLALALVALLIQFLTARHPA